MLKWLNLIISTCLRGLDLTVDIRMHSFSLPWNPSTVDTSTKLLFPPTVGVVALSFMA